MATAIITVRSDGSYHIKGDFKIATQAGRELVVDKDEVWLCRCGHSQSKPFCDGSHKKAGFSSNLDEAPHAAGPAPA